MQVGVPEEEILEEVPGLGGVEEVGGEHGVEGQSAHVDAESGQRSHEGLGPVGRERPATPAEQSGQPVPHGLVDEQLARDPRDVGGSILCLDDHGEPIERAASLDAPPSGCDRDEPVRLGEASQQCGRLRRGVDGDHLGLERGRRGHGRHGIVAHGLGQPIVEGAKLEEVEQPADRFLVERRHAELLGIGVARDVAEQHHHVSVGTHPRFVLGEAGSKFRGEVVEMFEDPVEAAVGGDELGRRLLPHSRDAGKVVGRVAAERGVLRVQRGRHARALLDAGLVVVGVVGDAAPVVEDPHERVLYELVRVPVTGDDEHLVAGVAGAGGQRGDDVVGLVAGELDDGDLERLDHLADQPHLLFEDVGGGVAVGLVVGDPLVAERRLGAVEGDRDGVGLVVAHQVQQHRREPVDRVRDLARRQRDVSRKGKEGAVGERVPVDQHHLRHRLGGYPARSRGWGGRKTSPSASGTLGYSGFRPPSMTSWATALSGRRVSIAVFCRNRNASFSLIA